MRLLHFVAGAAALLVAGAASADPIPPGGVGQNVEAVGYSDLNGKPGFKMSIQKVGERWYLYHRHALERGLADRRRHRSRGSEGGEGDRRARPTPRPTRWKSPTAR